MRFIKAFDIHHVPAELRKHIQPGQWVFNSDPASVGRYMGQLKGGTDVVAWQRNARGHKRLEHGQRGYYAALRTYAKQGRFV